MPQGQIRDKVHNEMYYAQFLKRMETDIVALSNKFWPIFFFLWLFYTLILMVFRIMFAFSTEATSMPFFEYYGNLHKMRPEQSLEFLKGEQFNNQIVFYPADRRVPEHQLLFLYAREHHHHASRPRSTSWSA
jgi:hypothetical protein